MPKSNDFKSYLKLEKPLRLVISYRIPRDLLQSLRPQLNVQYQHYRGPRRSQTPYYLWMELTLYLIIRSSNLQDKLKVNTNYFPTTRAKIAYVFSRTGRDVQTYLRPRYVQDLVDPFLSREEIIAYLSSIYKDPFKVQNARLNYKSLNIKRQSPSRLFRPAFYTQPARPKLPRKI